MSLSKSAALLLASAALVAGHGYVTSIVVDGTTYGGYLVDTYYYESDPPELIAWSTNATDDGYVAPTAYDTSNIVCHKGSAPGALSAPIAPGGSVTLTWNTWPDDHHGPVITYLANCNGSCTDVDKVDLAFFKIDAGGLINDTVIPGTWASDELIADSYSRTLTIPTDIAAGEYVLRHEIIALHGAEDLNGAQNYPQCINLNVTGSGTATPSGTLGEDLYKNTDPGIYVDIWATLTTYDIPGPTLYTAGSAATATVAAASSATTSTESVAAETTSASASISTSAVAEAETTQATSSVSQATTSVAQAASTGAPSGNGSVNGNGNGGIGGSNNGPSGQGKSSPSEKSSPSVTVASSSAATSTTSSSASETSGVLSGSCTEEGYWYCDAGTAFQRCVDGEWDASQSVASGTECTAGISDTLTITASSRKRSMEHARRIHARAQHA